MPKALSSYFLGKSKANSQRTLRGARGGEFLLPRKLLPQKIIDGTEPKPHCGKYSKQQSYLPSFEAIGFYFAKFSATTHFFY